MQGYEEDGYGDYEDYEEEGYEQDEEVEEEEYEEERPSAESQEYLELRARIKEQIRKKLQKENGSTVSKSQEMKKKSLDNYGSFFGPSQPVIAQRVIQESKSLLENPHLIFRSSNPQNNKKTTSSTGPGSKNGAHEQIPKFRDELKSKVQKIKDTRDYSFLLSDDAELTTTTKPPLSQNIAASKPDAQTAQMPRKSKQPSGSGAMYTRGGREEGKSLPMNGYLQSKSGAYKSASTSRSSLNSVDSKVQLLNKNGTGPGRPVASIDSRRQLQSKNAGPGRPLTSTDSKRQSQSNNGTGPGRPMASMDRRRQLENNGTGPGRPIGRPNGGSSQVPLTTGQKKASTPGGKVILPPARKPLPPKMSLPLPKHEVQRKQVLPEPKKILPVTKHSVASSGSQISKPVKQLSSRPSIKDSQLKRKSSRPFADEDEDDDEDMKAISMIRKMFNYDRHKNRDYDDDDLSDMEVPFDEIMREEDRSARIARKEDEEQLRLIEEEERQERMRRLAKKRKLSRH